MDSTLGDPPAGLDLSETAIPTITYTLVVTLALAFASVALRFIARRLGNVRLWWDDWLVLASFVFSGIFTLMIVLYLIPQGGLGKHVWVAPENGFLNYFKGLFIVEFSYNACILLLKLSVLAFYWRVFATGCLMRIAIWALVVMVFGQHVSSLFVIIFQCWPVKAFWQRFDMADTLDPSAYHCAVNIRDFLTVHGVLNALADVVLLLAPLPGVSRLRMRKSHKVAMTVVFLLGLFVTIIAIVRVYYVVDFDASQPDATWTLYPQLMWTGLEMNIATICVCLPTLRPLLTCVTQRPKSEDLADRVNTLMCKDAGVAESSLRLCSNAGTDTTARKSTMSEHVKAFAPISRRGSGIANAEMGRAERTVDSAEIEMCRTFGGARVLDAKQGSHDATS